MEKESTKKQILEAAQKVFTEVGLDGARMQKIADEADVNKAMLHYYFKSKNKLFKRVFRIIAPKVFPEILQVLNKDMSLFEKIEKLVDNYITVLINNNNEKIPLLILNELNKNPDEFSDIMLESFNSLDFDPLKELEKDIQEEVLAGKIRYIDPQELLINIISMCIFPVCAKTFLQKVIFKGEKDKCQQFLITRRETIPKFIINSIKSD